MSCALRTPKAGDWRETITRRRHFWEQLSTSVFNAETIKDIESILEERGLNVTAVTQPGTTTRNRTTYDLTRVSPHLAGPYQDCATARSSTSAREALNFCEQV